MPSNLTWWEAADYARAATPVRRIIWFNPIVWITYYPVGVFMRHEESNTALPAYVVGDETVLPVKNTQFGAPEFLIADWTTLPPNVLSDPPTPPGTPPPADPPGPPGLPPAVPLPDPPSSPVSPTPPASGPGSGSGTGSGGGGGTGAYPPGFPFPGGDPGGVVVIIPPLPPADPGDGRIPKVRPPKVEPTQPKPVPSCSAITGISISGSLSGVGPGQIWSVVARQPVEISLGQLGTDGTVSQPCKPTAGTNNCLVTFTCQAGPQLLRGVVLAARCSVAD